MSPFTASDAGTRLLLREEIAATVDDEAQIDDEIRALFSALKG